MLRSGKKESTRTGGTRENPPVRTNAAGGRPKIRGGDLEGPDGSGRICGACCRRKRRRRGVQKCREKVHDGDAEKKLTKEKRKHMTNRLRLWPRADKGKD